MVWGIIGALDAEVALIKEKMQIEKTVRLYGSDFYVGSVGNQQVVVVCCSIGTINAAVCTSAIIREFGAERVINVGIAGSMCRELRILDVVISEDVIFHDVDHDILEKYYPFQRSYKADSTLVEACVRAIGSLSGRIPQYKVGRIASGDVFVNDSALRARILNQYHPLCVEMEGAAIGQVAFMSGVPFLIIRTLSDNADDAADETYDNFLELAAEQSAGIVLRMLHDAQSK